MDEFLATLGVAAMRYAIRSGIALTSTYALSQCSRLLKSVDDKELHAELRELKKLLDSKMKIITPAIDLVELKSGRGNVSLESALPLTKSLHQKINALGRRIAMVLEFDEDAETLKPKQQGTRHGILRCVISDIRHLLDRIDREIPLLQLAITASGESLSTSLPTNISPSRLLQASTLLIVGDTQYSQDPARSVQIGPTFQLSLYMLFLGHACNKSTTSDPEQVQSRVYGLGQNERKPVWQEVIHKAKVRLFRSGASHGSELASPAEHRLGPIEARAEFSYHLELIEDFDDGRVHDVNEFLSSSGQVLATGIREYIPVYQLSKIFYADTGRILNIGNGDDGESDPVLLLKRDTRATRPSTAENFISNAISNDDESRSDDEQADVDRQLAGDSLNIISTCLEEPEEPMPYQSRLPKHFDPEWITLKVYDDDEERLDESEASEGLASESNDSSGSRHTSSATAATPNTLTGLTLTEQMKDLSIKPAITCAQSQEGNSPSTARSLEVNETDDPELMARSPFRTITSSLSLIEMLIRLAGLQEFQQVSHLSIPDHILTFFLEETSTTGLSGEARQTARREAKRRMGFDPYTDTPTEHNAKKAFTGR